MGKTSKEIRQITTQIELRSADNQENSNDVLEGYALKFEKWSERMGYFLPFREILSRNCLDEADMSDVVALVNHDQNCPMARNTISSGVGSLTLEVDNIGLRFQFIPTETTFASDLKTNVRANVVNKCSFAFSIDYGDPDAEEITYNEAEDIYERRINKIERLYDISIVTSPAYQDTEAVVGERSLDKMKELRKKNQAPDEFKQIMAELDLLDLL